MTRRTRMEDDWEPPALYGYGTGSLHGLDGPDEASPRLLGLKSVSRSAAWAIHKSKPQTRNPVGFCIKARR